MKTRTFIGMMVMLMALVGVAACDNEGNPVDNPVQGEIDPALLGQTTPEFTSSDFRDDLRITGSRGTGSRGSRGQVFDPACNKRQSFSFL